MLRNFWVFSLGFIAAVCVFACRSTAMAGSLADERLKSIAAASATLAKNEALAWQSVITADHRELADMRSASIAAMRAGNAQTVVVIQKLIIAVRQRLADEESGRPFFPGFNVPTTYTGADPIVAKAERDRNALVTAAEAELAKAQGVFRRVVLAADRHEIAERQRRVSAAMKALDARAVVLDMHRLELAKQQLQRDSSVRPGGAPVGTGSTFMGSGGSGTRVVYIVDHSGLMLYNFEFVAHHLRKAIMQLAPTQRFAVIVVGRVARFLGKPRLTYATTLAKKAFLDKFSEVHPSGVRN